MSYCDPQLIPPRKSGDPARPWLRQRDRTHVKKLLEKDRRIRIKRNRGLPRRTGDGPPGYYEFDRSPLARAENLRSWCLLPEAIDVDLWDAAQDAALGSGLRDCQVDPIGLGAEVVGWIIRRGRWPTVNELAGELSAQHGWSDTEAADVVNRLLAIDGSPVHITYTTEVIGMGEAPDWGDGSGYVAVKDVALYEAILRFRFGRLVEEIVRFDLAG